jgi:hypothetical protein
MKNEPNRNFVLALVHVLILLPSIASGSPVGGGWLNGGVDGEYFSNSDLAGEPSFTRRDARIDFDLGTLGRPGGSPESKYAALRTDNFSIRWSGKLSPRFTETYAFSVTADDGARVFVKKTGEPNYTLLIDAWNANGQHSAPMLLEAKATYEVRLDYHELTGPAGVSLRWSSPNTPEELIDSATLAAINITHYRSEIYANTMDEARDEWRDPTFGDNQALWPARDTNGWPLGDGAIIVWEGAEPASTAGRYWLSFKGRAHVAAQGNAAEFFVNGASQGSALAFEAGWDPQSMSRPQMSRFKVWTSSFSISRKRGGFPRIRAQRAFRK